LRTSYDNQQKSKRIKALYLSKPHLEAREA
jgi:hypothetical protein